MDRYEALHILGLDEDASEEDVRLAFRELAQILHPDRFQKNATLQARATEQFKLITNARDTLLKNNVYTRKHRSHQASQTATTGRPRSGGAATHQVRWNALEQARLYLIGQRDHERDNRRNGLLMLIAAFLISLFLRRYPPFMAVTSAFAVFGVTSAIAAHMRINTIVDRLEEILEEQESLHM